MQHHLASRSEIWHEAPPDGEIMMTLYPACNKTSLSRKPCIPDKNVTMVCYKEVMVAFPEAVMKKCVQRPLAGDWRWLHIRLAIKPRYVGNHASQIKTYYGSLSGSHSSSFRICHEKSHEAPVGEEITMTSYPVCNKTSLSWKTYSYIIDKMLLSNTFMKSSSLSNFYKKQQILILKTDQFIYVFKINYRTIGA